MREASGREESLGEALRVAREECDEALGGVAGLRRRLEEEGEVVEALRGQLFDYKQLVAQVGGAGEGRDRCPQWRILARARRGGRRAAATVADVCPAPPPPGRVFASLFSPDSSG